MATTLFTDRTVKIAYWNPEKRFVTAEKLQLEQYLKILGDIDLQEIESLDNPKFASCDLTIITADHIPEKEFLRWLRGLVKKFTTSGHIWKPAMLLSNVEFSVWGEDWLAAVKTNWYFDIVAKDHLSSLPIRAANLLKIHDHLHELRRYAETVSSLQSKVTDIEAQVKKQLK